MNDQDIRRKLRTIEKELMSVSKELLSNPAFLLEIGDIVSKSDNFLSVDISHDGKRVVITEDYESNNYFQGSDYDNQQFHYMGRSRTVDNLIDMQVLKCKNHSLELTSDSYLIVNHQGASMNRNLDYNNQQSDFKYGLSSSLYNSNGIEVNHVFYTDRDVITSGASDKSFNIDRLYREISSRVPSIRYNCGNVVFKPGRFNSNAEVNFMIRDRNYLGIAKVEKRTYSVTRGEDEKVVSSNIYQINSSNPGLIEIDSTSTLIDGSLPREQLMKVVQEKNQEFMTSGSTGYGADIMNITKSNTASI